MFHDALGLRSFSCARWTKQDDAAHGVGRWSSLSTFIPVGGATHDRSVATVPSSTRAGGLLREQEAGRWLVREQPVAWSLEARWWQPEELVAVVEGALSGSAGHQAAFRQGANPSEQQVSVAIRREANP